MSEVPVDAEADVIDELGGEEQIFDECCERDALMVQKEEDLKEFPEELPADSTPPVPMTTAEAAKKLLEKYMKRSRQPSIPVAPVPDELPDFLRGDAQPDDPSDVKPDIVLAPEEVLEKYKLTPE